MKMKERLTKYKHYLVIMFILGILVISTSIKRMHESRIPTINLSFVCPSEVTDNYTMVNNNINRDSFVGDWLIGREYRVTKVLDNQTNANTITNLDEIICNSEVFILSPKAKQVNTLNNELDYLVETYDPFKLDLMVDNIEISLIYYFGEHYTYSENPIEQKWITIFGYFERDNLYYYIKTEYTYEQDDKIAVSALEKVLEERYQYFISSLNKK